MAILRRFTSIYFYESTPTTYTRQPQHETNLTTIYLLTT